MLYLLQTAVSFVLVLSLVITIHELGHFWAARAFGTAIERFSIGFGKAIFSLRDKHGVEWRMGWIPLGGYVKFAGDANAASVPDTEDLEEMRRWVEQNEGPTEVAKYLHFKPLWQRAVVVAAGPFANFLLAITLFAILLMTVGETTLKARISSVAPGSVAEAAGFKAGDIVLKTDGRQIDSFEDVKQYVMLRAGVPITFTVERGGLPRVLQVTPVPRRIANPTGGDMEVGTVGLVSQPTRADVQHVRYGPLQAVAGGVKRTWDVLETTLFYIGRLITGKMSADQLGGPLGIAQISGAAAKAGGEGAANAGQWMLGAGVALTGLAAMLSVSIGFMNLLPIPVLDGGHLLFYAYEAVARRPLGAKAQAAGYRVGLALLLSFMLFATWNDLQRLRVFSFLGGLFS